VATIVTFNGLSYSVPATGEENWGGVTKVDGLLVTLATNGFQKTGGLFTLSADADLGASAGLKSIYYKSRSSSPASAGIVRLGNAETMGWRNFADSGNLLLSVNSSNQLLYNGTVVIGMSPSLTINTALIADGTGTIVSSVVTSTELAKLSGILSTAVGISDTNTLTNKKLSDSTVTFVDNGDATKQLAFECSGITAGQTRTWTVPDASSTMVGIAVTQTLTNKTISNSENTLQHLDNGRTLRNYSISCSVGSSALTIALKDASGSDCSSTSKAFIGFRSATAATGTSVTRTVSAALSVIVSSGSTLGIASGSVAQYVYVYAVDNGGTVALAVSGLVPAFDEGTIQSTTAEGGAGAADSPRVLYSTSALSNKAVRLIARLKFTLTTAGTWDEVPDEVSLVPFRTMTSPTIQSFTTSSGTYTTPIGVKWIRVRMVGAGGGGGSSGTAAFGAATDGGNTTFGTTLLVANGGAKGSQGSGGAGGTASLGTGPVGIAIAGGAGGGNFFFNVSTAQSGSHSGAASAFGGAGGGGPTGGAGTAAATNSGSGGGGGGTGATAGSFGGSGGGAGGFVDAIIAAPLASYSYAVGAKGTGGSAGTNGFAGGNGGDGIIIVEEYYDL
jgi:hypothetical protein